MGWTVENLAEYVYPALVALDHVLFEFEQQGGPTIVINLNGVPFEMTAQQSSEMLAVLQQIVGGA